MDFDLLMEYLSELLEFVKPVSGLIADAYQAICLNIPDLGTVFDIEKWFFIIAIILMLFFKLASK